MDQSWVEPVIESLWMLFLVVTKQEHQCELKVKLWIQYKLYKQLTTVYRQSKYKLYIQESAEGKFVFF